MNQFPCRFAYILYNTSGLNELVTQKQVFATKVVGVVDKKVGCEWVAKNVI